MIPMTLFNCFIIGWGGVQNSSFSLSFYICLFLMLVVRDEFWLSCDLRRSASMNFSQTFNLFMVVHEWIHYWTDCLHSTMMFTKLQRQAEVLGVFGVYSLQRAHSIQF